MSTRSSSSCCSCPSTEESRSSSTTPSTVGSKINTRDSSIGRTTITSSLSTTSSFDIVQNQFQDLIHLKNVLINKSRQQMSVTNYIVDQQKERLHINNNAATDDDADDDRISLRSKDDDDDTEQLGSPRRRGRRREKDKEGDTKEEEEGEKVITISCVQYETLMRQLEVERIEHAKTKTKGEEFADRLDFARGQIEILQKQLQREKDNFRRILGSVEESSKVGDERKDQLEIRVRELHDDNQQLARRVRTKDSEIEKLQEALTKEKSSKDQRIIDIEVRRCQDDYISSVLGKSGTGSGRTQPQHHAKKGYPPSVKDHRKTKLTS